jgi:hypothetical protein
LIEQHPLWQTQLDLEARMVSDGVDKFREALAKASGKGAAGDKGAAREQVLALVNPVATALRRIGCSAYLGGRGRRPQAYPALKTMDPDVVAFVSIKVVINNPRRRLTPQHAAAVHLPTTSGAPWRRKTWSLSSRRPSLSSWRHP